MGSIYKNKGKRSKPWQARPHNPYLKEREPSRNFATEQEARDWMAREERRIALRWAGLETEERRDVAMLVTVGEQAERFLASYNRRGSKTKSAHVRYVVASLGSDLPITAFTRGDIIRWRARMASEHTRYGRPAASQTQCDRLRAAFDIFESAVDDEVRKDNPAAGVRIEEWSYDVTPPRYLSDAEFRRVMWHVPEWARIAFQVMVSAGLRIGEATALTGAAFDLTPDAEGWGVLHVTQHWNAPDDGTWVILPGTKAGPTRTRQGAIRPSLVAALTEHREVTGWVNDRLILRDPRRPFRDITPYDLRAVWDRAWKLADLEGQKATPHDLRATFARGLRDAGVHDDVIEDCMGHWTKPVLRRYSGTMTGRQQAEAQRRAGIEATAKAA